MSTAVNIALTTCRIRELTAIEIAQKTGYSTWLRHANPK